MLISDNSNAKQITAMAENQNIIMHWTIPKLYFQKRELHV